MKSIYRRLVRLMSRLGTRWFATTYGDVAEMHAGPCQRCVGMAVVGGAEAFPNDMPTVSSV